MLTFSQAFLNNIKNDKRHYQISLEVTLRDLTTLTIENDRIWDGTFKIEDATSQSGVLSIGAAVTGKMTVTINNIDGAYSSYDFAGASIEAYIGMDGCSDHVRIGIYTVTDSNYSGASLISLTAKDHMTYFDVSCENTTIFNSTITLQQMVSAICLQCGVDEPDTYPTIMGSYTISKAPSLKSLSYADLITKAAQIACCYAKIDNNGKLKFAWYDFPAAESVLNGVVNGQFTVHANGVHEIDSINSLTVATDIVNVSQVKVTEEFPSTADNPKHTYTASGSTTALEYRLKISNNRLIDHSKIGAEWKGQDVANRIYNALHGHYFRPFNASVLNNPAMEAGDMCVIVDRKGRPYLGFISQRTFSAGNYENLVCDAAEPKSTQTDVYTAEEKAMAQYESDAYARENEYVDKLMNKFYTFTNSSQVDIADGDEEMILRMDFASETGGWIMMEGEILADTEAGQVDFRYVLNGTELTRKPKQTVVDGKTIFSLLLPFTTVSSTPYQLEVWAEATGGDVSVPINGASFVIWGQGLPSQEAWTGILEIFEAIPSIALDDITIAPFSDTIIVDGLVPIGPSVTVPIGAISLGGDTSVDAFGADIYMNRDFMDDYTHQDLSAFTHQYLNEHFFHG